MPYYSVGDYYGRGDYYQGDYYQGDPFSLRGLIGGVAKFVGGIVPGPAGAILKAGGGLIAGRGPGTSAPAGFTPNLPAPPFAGGLAMQGEPGKVLVRPGGEAGIPFRPPIGIIPRGLHPNRSTYVTRGGGTSHWPTQLLVHPKGTENVRSRRMNVGNARALKRALRRAHGFARLARHVIATTRHYKKVGRKKR